MTVEESQASETYVDFQKGMRFESGYAHPAFVTHPEQMEAVYVNPKILIMDKGVSFEGLLNLFKEVTEKGLSLVIIAPSLDQRMGEFLIENKRKGDIRALYINAPYASNFQKEFLQDLAVLTGATYIPLTEGGRIEDIKFSDLGECEKIVSTHNSTIIVNGKGDKSSIDNRITQVKTLLKSTAADFDSSKLQERLAKLTTGIAVVKVGGSTQVEMQERMERAIDAVAATKAALEDGIVIGGERAYFQILPVLDKQYDPKFIFSKESGLTKKDIKKYESGGDILVNGDVSKTTTWLEPLSKDTIRAFEILKLALQKPFEQLLTNSGLDIGMYKERLLNSKKEMGVDVTNGAVVDMVVNGIIDPAKVVKCALRNAVSVAIQFLIIHATIAPGDVKEVIKK